MRFLRSMVVVMGLASATVGLMPGCSNRLGPVTASQKGGSINRPTLPDIFVEKAKECVAENGAQLDPGRLVFESTIEVTEDRYKYVTIDGLPDTAPDLGVCLRIALGDMPIADEPFRQGVETLKYRRQEALAEQRKLMGHPIVIVVAGVTIVVSEVVLEAGAVTILLAVSVKVIDKAAKDVAEKVEEEGWKAQCAAHYTACMATSFAGKRGNNWNQTRCGACLAACTDESGWPYEVGNGSCEYWRRNWR